MSSYNLSSHMQTLAQTQKMDQLDQEVHELREEVTTLRVGVEKLTNLVSSVQWKPQPLCMQPPQQQCQPLCIQQPRHQAQKAPQYDPIPMKYAELLPTLLRQNLVQTRPPPLIPKKLSARWRPDLFCAFHQGAQSHDEKHCFSLKIEV